MLLATALALTERATYNQDTQGVSREHPSPATTPSKTNLGDARQPFHPSRTHRWTLFTSRRGSFTTADQVDDKDLQIMHTIKGTGAHMISQTITIANNVQRIDTYPDRNGVSTTTLDTKGTATPVTFPLFIPTDVRCPLTNLGTEKQLSSCIANNDRDVTYPDDNGIFATNLGNEGAGIPVTFSPIVKAGIDCTLTIVTT